MVRALCGCVKSLGWYCWLHTGMGVHMQPVNNSRYLPDVCVVSASAKAYNYALS